MKHLLTLLLLLVAVSALTATPAAAQTGGTSIIGAGPGGYTRLPVNVSFVPGVGIGDMIGGPIISQFSLNILAGRFERLDGAEFGGIMNWETESASGAQFAGVLNMVDGPMTGAQFGGVLNLVDGPARGAQFAGVTNLTGGDVTAQFAGVANSTAGSVTGGIQAAGVINRTAGSLSGLQLAGVVNLAEEVSGAQISGVVNVAGRVHGAQIGLINIAEENDGFVLGLVSIVESVPLHVDVWADETGVISAALRSGTRRWYSLLGAAAQPGSDPRRWGFLAGLGYHADLGSSFYLNVDAINYGLFDRSWESGTNLSKLRLIGGWQLADGIALFAGPTLNVQVGENMDGIGLAPSWTIYDHRVDDIWITAWPGVVAGIRLF